ncbi:MAG: hypothetical protein Q7U75_00010 [Desulfobacterales bacterium]|nr:hypothetical protein [Desulfobacterales bacterium]
MRKSLAAIGAATYAWFANASTAFAAAATGSIAVTGNNWTIENLPDKLNPIVNVIFPIIIFAAVIRIMWAGVQMATGQMTETEAKGDKGPKKVMETTIKGVLWVIGAWIGVNLAIELARRIFS